MDAFGTGTAYTAFACTYILGGIGMLLSFWRFRGVRKLDEGEGGGEKMEASSKRGSKNVMEKKVI